MQGHPEKKLNRAQLLLQCHVIQQNVALASQIQASLLPLLAGYYVMRALYFFCLPCGHCDKRQSDTCPGPV